jgi:hypothetical protein
MKLLAKEPDDRYATATDVHRALDAARGDRRFADVTLPGGTAEAMFAPPESGTRAATGDPSSSPAAFDDTASPDSQTAPALPNISESVLAEVAPAALRRGRGGAIETDRLPAQPVTARPTVKAPIAGDTTAAPPTRSRRAMVTAILALVVAAVAIVVWFATRGGAGSPAMVADAATGTTPITVEDAAAIVPATADASVAPPPVDAPIADEPTPDARRRKPKPDARLATPSSTDAAIRPTPPSRVDATPF